MAAQAGVSVWQFTHQGQPRAAVGFSFGLLAAALSRLGLLPNLSSELAAAVAAMRTQQETIRTNVPSARNPAKRMAGQLMGRWVVVIGSGILAPVARRWKGQLGELAKSWAQFEFLPEVDHNTLAGVMQPEDMLPASMVIFLRGTTDHPRNRLRIELTKKTFMLEGIGTDFIDAAGESPLEQLWTCLHFGDYSAYYLAIGYGIDPTPIPAIEGFKRELNAAG
jgi:glucose/mannose-6-phosphate isomerase